MEGTWSVPLWMLVTITVVIAVKVVTGTFLNRKRKVLSAIRQELLATRARLEHADQRHQAAESMMSFGERQKVDLRHRIELCTEELEQLTTSGSEGEAKERVDPEVPLHMRTRSEDLFGDK
jgi:hypothetical protein